MKGRRERKEARLRGLLSSPPRLAGSVRLVCYQRERERERKSKKVRSEFSDGVATLSLRDLSIAFWRTLFEPRKGMQSGTTGKHEDRSVYIREHDRVLTVLATKSDLNRGRHWIAILYTQFLVLC